MKKTCIISRLPSINIWSFIQIFKYILRYHSIQFMCKISHIFQSIRCYSSQRFQHRNVNNLQIPIHQYIKFHKSFFQNFCVIAGIQFYEDVYNGWDYVTVLKCCYVLRHTFGHSGDLILYIVVTLEIID
jgi:hypothetical protein